MILYDVLRKRIRATMLIIGCTLLFARTSVLAQFPVEYDVEMRDGVKLATDVYRVILDNDPKPVILIRTPYGKDGTEWVFVAQLLLAEDYSVVLQDSRGTGDSEGFNDIFESAGWGERQDGYDTIEWIAARTWCDGNIGMFGMSALAINAYMAAGAQPPALKCAVVAFGTGDLYDHAAYQGGELRASLIDGWVGDQNPLMIARIVEHPTRDSYWGLGDAEERIPLINVPMLHIAGWYDCFGQGNLNMFTGLQARGAVGALGNQQLIVGPWTHSNLDSRTQGDLEYPLNSVLDLDETLNRSLDWFDYWLKGDNNGVMDNPPVRYYVMGDVDDSSSQWNEWRENSVWPPAGQERRLFFHADGDLRGGLPQGSAAYPETYRYDPSNPVPSVGGANLEIDDGPMDQRPVENRGDVLLYTSDELTEPLEVTGRIWVELYASSSAVDTDWTAKLCDVYPDGRSMLVCDGILQARYRESTSAPMLMTPGTTYRFEIDLWSTSIVFNEDHRIRVAISSSNSPRFEANLNNGWTPRAGGASVIAANTVYHDTGRRSCIILPVTSPANHPIFSGTPTAVRNWQELR